MIRAEMSGRFRLESFKRDSKGRKHSVRELTDWFPNIITNSGLDYVATHYGWCNYAFVGTDNTTPAATDLELGNRIAVSSQGSQNGTSTVLGVSPYYSERTVVRRFGEGVAAGNLSEVGLGWSSSALEPIFCRALILDGGGNPTTITVLSDEYLDVYYEIRYYPIITDVTGTVVFTGNIGGSYDYIFRRASLLTDQNPIGSGIYNQLMIPFNSWGGNDGPYYWESFYGNIGTMFNMPTSQITSSNAFSPSNSSYVNGTYTLTATLTFGLTQSNHASGIRSIYFPWGVKYHQIQFDPAIPKTSNDIVTLTIRQQWARR